MKNKAKEPGMVELKNEKSPNDPGVLLNVTTKGTGAAIKSTDFVYVNYVGKLTDGTVFDATTGKEPALFPVKGVIPGFSQALQQLSVGSKATIVIPSELAYGREAVGDGKVPANSILTFEVEILKLSLTNKPQWHLLKVNAAKQRQLLVLPLELQLVNLRDNFNKANNRIPAQVGIFTSIP